MDLNFTFCCPTKIYFRNQGVGLIGQIIQDDYGFKKVYLVYGGQSLKKTGTYDKVVSSLKEHHIEFLEYGGVQANPDIEDIRKMVAAIKAYQPELILAVGGGSVIDAAKCLAHGYYYDGDPLDFNKHKVQPLHALPVATILTLAASGSEMSDSCVVSDRKNNFKNGFNAPSNYPLFSLMDPSLTLTVPMYHVGCGLADMFSHSFERYFSDSHGMEPSDDFALAIMKNIVEVSYAVLKNPNDIEARRTMMICGSLAHNGFTSYGKGKVMMVHKAEHQLSGKYPQLIHGQGIALLMPPYLTINKVLFKDKILKMGKVLFNMKSSASVKSVIDTFTAWLATLPIAHSFDELNYGIAQEDILAAEKLLKRK